MDGDVTGLIAFALILLKALMVPVALVFLISGLDDLFIDLCYAVISLRRRLRHGNRTRMIDRDALFSTPEKPLAVMVPAWDESAVIGAMLDNTLRSIEYQNMRIFVGTYPNDAATQSEVKKVRARSDRVELVVCPHEGPTNKADCLNWIFQGIRSYEQRHNVKFEIVVMEDCEDVVHPLLFKLFNYVIPKRDMVQVPVLSLPPKWYDFTAGHYLDEFAQGHYKDMVVREILDGSIPAAGVGCAFSRRALEALSAFNHNELFSVDSLTEDYDIGLRLKQLDLSQAFVKVSLPKTVLKRVWWKRGEAQVSAPDYVCVREYFPSHWRAATRQKSRWVVGIALQGWASLGWSGSLATRYMLARDRKALITNLANVLGYVIVIALLIVWIGMWLAPDPYRFPPLVEHSWWLWYVIMINGAFFLLRVLMRAYCVQRFHGWREAALSAPRMIWGNFINFAATARAIRLYARYLWTGNPIAWDKTAHAYPSADGLQEFSRRLGERLLQHSLVTVGQLEEALKRQHDEKRLLGAILCDMGALRGEDLDAVLEGRFKRQAA